MNRDQNFLAFLKKTYQEIIQTPHPTSAEKSRKKTADLIQRAFSQVDYQIKGSELLPYESGCIFIYNHLKNHPYLTVDKHFQITLDSHFISSLILQKYYKDPGTRVIRYSLPHEKQHQSYYDKFDFIRVYAHEFTPAEVDRKKAIQFNQKFYGTASHELDKGKNLVLGPEGNSFSTEESPGMFRKGVFKLACNLENQPTIVPIVMANFDKLPSTTTYKCQIMSPFKMSDYGITNPNDPGLDSTVKMINQNYKKWVNDLVKEDPHFEKEVNALKKEVDQKPNKNEMIVFYGSSTIRLWKNLNRDFKEWNTLNLGFGGAFIHSLSQYFNLLFSGFKPKAIILYLGGNDLTLGMNSTEIAEKIIDFFKVIRLRFPDTIVLNVSIKPSYERESELRSIEKINALINQYAQNKKEIVQLDFFNLLMDRKTIKKDVFLRDGLHLNVKGYAILKNLIHSALNKMGR
jgi:lysophospholipase L1-like esterase